MAVTIPQFVAADHFGTKLGLFLSLFVQLFSKEELQDWLWPLRAKTGERFQNNSSSSYFVGPIYRERWAPKLLKPSNVGKSMLPSMRTTFNFC